MGSFGCALAVQTDFRAAVLASEPSVSTTTAQGRERPAGSDPLRRARPIDVHGLEMAALPAAPQWQTQNLRGI